MAQAHVVVDGSNIATEGRSLPSLAQLDEAVRAFLAEHPHDLCTVIVDATFEHRIDASERKLYDEALAAGELLTPPAGSVGRGDKFILEIANRSGATVFSNDSFQEFHGEYEWLFDEGRLVGGKPVPGVGWVFIERTPVRGPKSRMATRAASRKRTRAESGSAAKKTAKAAPAESAPPKARRGRKAAEAPAEASPVDEVPPRGRGRRKAPAAEPPPAAVVPDDDAPGRRRRRRGGAPPQEPVNPPLPFIEFVAEYQVGSEVAGEVTEFSSHGAYITVNGLRCYAPLKLLGEPAPRAAREVLNRGETRTFVVHAIDAPRRSVDLALPGVVEIEAPAVAPVPTKRRSSKRATVDTASSPAPRGAGVADQAPAAAGAELPESEAALATKKAAAKKSPAKKSTAKKAPAKKATAKKAPAKKATAKKSTAKKSIAKKSTAKKSTAKKSTAKKSTAKKSTAKKSTAKKSTAKKATAKKATAKKASAAKKR
jgi:hypothetical protein